MDTDRSIYAVLDQAWLKGISVQSDFFRKNAAYVALCASEGYITTIISPDRFGNIWRLTPEGSRRLFESRLYYSMKGSTDEPERPSTG